MNNPLVSIIIPIYNSETHLQITLDSVIKQTYKNLQIILVDDGSKDKSYQICVDYSEIDKRIFPFKQENKGASEARNYGLTHIKGDFFMFVDSDDWIEPEMVSSLLSNALNNKSDLVMCGMVIDYFKSDRILDYSRTVLLNKRELYGNENIAENIIDLVENESINGPCCKLIRTNIVVDNKLMMQPHIKIQEDLEFNIQLLKHISSLTVIEEPYYHYSVRNSESLTKKYFINRFTMINAVHDELLNYYLDRSYQKELLSVVGFLYIKNFYSAILNLFHRNCDLTTKEKYKLINDIYKSDKHKSMMGIAKRDGLKYKILKLMVSINNITMILLFTKILWILREKFKLTF
ncbi:glycosyltransferase family 2 protein [Paenibacillus endoradicis]|uniref:glycosyltransferase family 2 protein n=1 Tax=Paenibacillus endoradicis TaxID=2972487 RepID=UPI0021596537|nr:glycosyltransferase family 2 protein [Paenibacillus endoradicis]MCR8660659.1 glycosyltransferase [Paenibacillus endoradicis]